MDQNPPFPSPEELRSKLSEFMKTNFGDKVSFSTFTQPETAEATGEEKPPKADRDEFGFDFLPRDIKAHLDRFVIKQDEADSGMTGSLGRRMLRFYTPSRRRYIFKHSLL